MGNELQDWTERKRPSILRLEGRFVTLEKLSSEKHGEELYGASTMIDAEARFRWLPEFPPKSREDFADWLQAAESSTDPLFYAVIENRTGQVAGRQTLMRIDEYNGVIEIGNILWSSMISKTPVTTEAFYLFAKHVFEDLGYRRFEWKCNNENVPSKNAALRYGMKAEGVFRQHMIVKGKNRDTAWFSMLDHEWLALKRAFEIWLAPENFDQDGNQLKKLQQIQMEMVSD